MKIRSVLSIISIILFVSAAFIPLPESPEELLGGKVQTPEWLTNVAWIPNLDDPDNIEYMGLLRDGQGFWTPTHADESQAIMFTYELKEQRGKNKYALDFRFEDGKTSTAPFTHAQGRYKVKHPNGVVVFQHRISFKKAPFKGSAKVFYAHPERRG